MNYKALSENIVSFGEFKIVPIRFKDRFKIMKWRNEQMYHLRQASLLTSENQDAYFTNVIAPLFEAEKPNQVLFSYLQGNKCIGYGGLVHINWNDQHAEISFIMDTDLEKTEFEIHWKNFLGLIENVAFKDLGLHKICTYAFDLRPKLYPIFEERKFRKDAILREHVKFNGKFIDVVIHSKINN